MLTELLKRPDYLAEYAGIGAFLFAAQAMPLEDAYKVLKATPGTTWESIEQTRRTLVHQSHPSHLKTLSAEKRTQALAEATKVNVAYAALSQTRCGGR